MFDFFIRKGLSAIAALAITVSANPAFANASAILSLCALYGIAVLCKEHALLLPALLAAIEWFVVDAPAPARWDVLAQRVRTAAPLLIALFVVAAVYLTTRTAVVGEVLGEKHLVPVHGVRRLWVMLVVVPQWLRLLIGERLQALEEPLGQPCSGLGIQLERFGLDFFDAHARYPTPLAGPAGERVNVGPSTSRSSA